MAGNDPEIFQMQKCNVHLDSPFCLAVEKSLQYLYLPFPSSPSKTLPCPSSARQVCMQGKVKAYQEKQGKDEVLNLSAARRSGGGVGGKEQQRGRLRSKRQRGSTGRGGVRERATGGGGICSRAAVRHHRAWNARQHAASTFVGKRSRGVGGWRTWAKP